MIIPKSLKTKLITILHFKTSKSIKLNQCAYFFSTTRLEIYKLTEEKIHKQLKRKKTW